MRSKDGSNVLGQQIPIHAIAVFCSCISPIHAFASSIPKPIASAQSVGSVSGLNDQLKSRFPPGIPHIRCRINNDETDWTCSTTYDPDGSIVSKEIHIYGKHSWRDAWTHDTKDLVHYKPGYIPPRNNQTPVWTQVFKSSSPSGSVLGIPPSELVLPAGMYRHELTKHAGEGWSRLVWKSSRG